MVCYYLKILCLFLLFLGSCAKVPDSDLAHLSDPIPLTSALEAAHAREFFEEGGWPTENWWEMFEDPQLSSLIEQALVDSPTLQKALAKVAIAEQEARKEKAALFPKLDFAYEEQWQYFSKNGFIRSFYPTTSSSPKIPATDNQLDLSLYFNYELDFFGRNRNLFRAALGQAKAEYAEAKQATLMLTTLIAQTYIELQTKLQQMQVLKDRLDDRYHLFELTGSRREEGLDAAIAVLEKEEGLYQIQQSILMLEKEISLDKHSLSVLVGVGPDTDLCIQPMTAIFERAVSLPSNLSSDLLARRPDLIAQIWKVEAAARQIGAAKADFYPRVNLMAFAQLESISFNKLLNISSRQGGVVPAVHLPIFTGGKLRANLRGKVASFNEATYRYNELLLNAAKEVADQIAILSTTFDTLTYQIDNVAVAEAKLELELSRFDQGVNDFLSVLQRDEEVLMQRYQLFGLERDYLLACLKMIKALGGGYHTEHVPSHPERLK
jgi:NodT family efflux transporter outer membrane factor (OMF) lipoprotein